KGFAFMQGAWGTGHVLPENFCFLKLNFAHVKLKTRERIYKKLLPVMVNFMLRYLFSRSQILKIR
ncbi:MAG: hypothetical protein CRN43_14870, partial [Candidatus Nephrothrix sp. EaCA]